MSQGSVVVRHSLAIRVLHWINVLTLTILLMSGLQIFNAHPMLDWGRQSYGKGQDAVLALESRAGPGGPRGIVRAGSVEFDTTGVFGVPKDSEGKWVARGFPSWATLPGSKWLAMGRRWHFFFAWVLVVNGLTYLLYSIVTGHLVRDLLPTFRDIREIPRSVVDHLRLRRAHGAAALRYNVLQRVAYLAVILVVLPFTILMGLGLSPALNAFDPGLVNALGGRQSIRTLHFAGAAMLVLFTLIHVAEVLLNGPLNEMRSMITGRFRISKEADASDR